MKLSEILKEEAILLNFSAPDKWQTIKSMIEHLVSKGLLAGRFESLVIDALFAREKISSTGMENGVALPHATIHILNQSLIALAISKSGVPFECQDKKPARIILLLIIPKMAVKIHIQTLVTVAKMLSSEKMRQSLINSKTAQEVINIIKQEEGKEDPTSSKN